MNRLPISPELALRETRAWLEHAVIGLNLCPFAKAVQVKNQIRYVFSDASDEQALLDTLCSELHFLAESNPDRIDTTLIVHPRVLEDFADYNDFIDLADAAVEELGYAGVLQVASFHPHYQFAGTDADDVTNATNRSPFPCLHLLREASVERAVAAFPDPEAIFEANRASLERLGAHGWSELQARCRREAEADLGPDPAGDGNSSRPTE